MNLTEELLSAIADLRSRVDALERQDRPDPNNITGDLAVSGTTTIQDDARVGGGLSVGDADLNVATGSIQATGYLILGGVIDNAFNSKLRMASFVLANGATAQVLPGINGAFGMVFINGGSDGSQALFFCSAGVTHEIADPSGHYSPTAGTPNSTNIYWSAANSRMEIQNNRGGNRGYEVMYFSR